jgi:hypothetical protein
LESDREAATFPRGGGPGTRTATTCAICPRDTATRARRSGCPPGAKLSVASTILRRTSPCPATRRAREHGSLRRAASTGIRSKNVDTGTSFVPLRLGRPILEATARMIRAEEAPWQIVSSRAAASRGTADALTARPGTVSGGEAAASPPLSVSPFVAHRPSGARHLCSDAARVSLKRTRQRCHEGPLDRRNLRSRMEIGGLSVCGPGIPARPRASEESREPIPG